MCHRGSDLREEWARSTTSADIMLILSPAFTQYLEREGWEVHTDLHDLSSEPSLESQATTDTDKEQLIETQLKSLHVEHKALILRNSHIGGHKFAGNCIVRDVRLAI
jgi:hypothetical protein